PCAAVTAIASTAHRRSTAQVHAACSRVPPPQAVSIVQCARCINVAHTDRPSEPARLLALMFVALIRAAHFSISLWMKFLEICMGPARTYLLVQHLSRSAGRV